MSQAMQKAREDSTGVRQYLLASYYLAAGNLSLTTIAFGVVLLALGGTVVVAFHKVFSAMFAIWGASAILLGGLAYAALKINALVAELSE